MIAGVGVDLVDIVRFERQLQRTPRLRERLFTPAERDLAPRSLAARYAAKEALIKALGGSDGVHWNEIEIAREGERVAPRFAVSGATADTLTERGVTRLHLSMSHDAGLAVAYVVAEAAGAGAGEDGAFAVGASPAEAARAASSGADGGGRAARDAGAGQGRSQTRTGADGERLSAGQDDEGAGS